LACFSYFSASGFSFAGQTQFTSAKENMRGLPIDKSGAGYRLPLFIFSTRAAWVSLKVDMLHAVIGNIEIFVHPVADRATYGKSDRAGETRKRLAGRLKNQQRSSAGRFRVIERLAN
jgi:hypothetical protein